MSAPDHRAKLDRNHPDLWIGGNIAMLGVARSGVYRTRRVANDNGFDLMRRLDELFLRWPFLGSRCGFRDHRAHCSDLIARGIPR